MKEFGTPDSDTTAYETLINHIKEMEVDYILHHQRVPIDAKACRLPQSLKVQAVLVGGKVITCQQAAPGHPAKVLI